MALHAYRFFSNNCREAMTRYQEVFGGRLDIMSFADMPPGQDAPDDVDADLVMHAALVFADGDMLMASDDPTGDGGPVTGVSLHYTADSIRDAERIFEALADAGSVEMPLEEVFWALRFGSCTDRFGTSWMISVDHPSDPTIVVDQTAGL
jgi:PhnB protein